MFRLGFVWCSFAAVHYMQRRVELFSLSNCMLRKFKLCKVQLEWGTPVWEHESICCVLPSLLELWDAAISGFLYQRRRQLCTLFMWNQFLRLHVRRRVSKLLSLQLSSESICECVLRHLGRVLGVPLVRDQFLPSWL
jgi:hypothetical protein